MLYYRKIYDKKTEIQFLSFLIRFKPSRNGKITFSNFGDSEINVLNFAIAAVDLSFLRISSTTLPYHKTLSAIIYPFIFSFGAIMSI